MCNVCYTKRVDCGCEKEIIFHVEMNDRIGRDAKCLHTIFFQNIYSI